MLSGQQAFDATIRVGQLHSIFKGIVHNFFVYRSNLIFWIVMGCGIADIGRRGLKTPKTHYLLKTCQFQFLFVRLNVLHSSAQISERDRVQ